MSTMRTNGSDPTSADAVEKAVSSAYSVLEDYVQRAARTASFFSPPMSRGGPAMSDPTQEMTNLLIKYWTETAKLWFTPWSSFMPGGPPGWPPGAPASSSWDRGQEASGNGRPEAAAGERRLTVSVEVASSRPAEVCVDLPERALSPSLFAQPLHAVDGEGKPPLSAVQLELVDGGLKVQVTVPKDQPAGAYTGAIVVRAKGRAAGTLTVTVR
jgi:hypothetical protein